MTGSVAGGGKRRARAPGPTVVVHHREITDPFSRSTKRAAVRNSPRRHRWGEAVRALGDGDLLRYKVCKACGTVLEEHSKERSGARCWYIHPEEPEVGFKLPPPCGRLHQKPFFPTSSTARHSWSKAIGPPERRIQRCSRCNLIYESTQHEANETWRRHRYYNARGVLVADAKDKMPACGE